MSFINQGIRIKISNLAPPRRVFVFAARVGWGFAAMHTRADALDFTHPDFGQKKRPRRIISLRRLLRNIKIKGTSSRHWRSIAHSYW
jgi:hypothetical protein